MIPKSQKRYGVVWVDPEFHQLLKVRSAEENLSIVDFTKKLAQKERDNQEPVQSVNGFQIKRKWKFEL